MRVKRGPLAKANLASGGFVKRATHLEALGFGPRTNMRAKGFGVVHVHWISRTDGDVDVFGAKVVERVGDKPSVVDPSNVGVTVYRATGTMKPFFGTCIKTCPVGIPATRGL